MVTPRGARCLRPGTALLKQVTRSLKASYAPEPMTSTLTLVHADTPAPPVFHETTYTAI